MTVYSRSAQIFLMASVVFMLLIGCTKKTETVSDDPIIEPAIVSSPRELIQKQGYDDLAFFFDASFEAMRCNPFTAVTHGNRFIYCNTTIIEISSQKIVGEFNIPISKQIPDLYFNTKEKVLYIFIEDKLYAYDETSGIMSHKIRYSPIKEIIVDSKGEKVEGQNILYACEEYTISTLCSNGTAYLLKNQEGKHSIVDSSYNNLYYSLNKNIPIFGTLVSINDSRRICQTRIVNLTRGKVEISMKNGLVFCDTSMRHLFVIAATDGDDSDDKYYFTASLFTTERRRPLYTHKIAAFHEDMIYNDLHIESIFKGCTGIDWTLCVKYVQVFDNGDVICNINNSITHVSKNGGVTSVPFYTRCYDALSENIIVTHESCYLSCVNIISLADRFAKRKVGSELIINSLKYVYWYRKENIQMTTDPRSGDVYAFHDDVLYCYHYGETEPYTRVEMDVLVNRMVFSWTKQALVLSAVDDGRDIIIYVNCEALSENRIEKYSLYGDRSKYEYIRYEYDTVNNSILREEIAWDYESSLLPDKLPSEMNGGKLLYCDDKVVVWMKKDIDYGALGIYDKHTEAVREVTIENVVFYVNKDYVYAYDDDGIYIYDYFGKLLEKRNRPDAMVNAMRFDMTDKYIYMVKGDDNWCFESMYIYDRVRDRLNIVSIHDSLCINEDNRWVYKMYGLVAIARVFHGRPILISSAFNRCEDPLLKQQFRELSSLKW